jgi:hypothetical protein
VQLFPEALERDPLQMSLLVGGEADRIRAAEDARRMRKRLMELPADMFSPPGKR